MGLLGLCCRRRTQGHPGSRRAGGGLGLGSPVGQIESEPDTGGTGGRDTSSWHKVSRKRKVIVPLQIDQDGTVSDRSVTVSWSDDSPRSIESAFWGIEQAVEESLETEIVPKSDHSSDRESDSGDVDQRSKDKDARSIPHQRKVALETKGDRAREPYPED